MGDDESIFKGNSQSSIVWKIDGVGGLRKKGDGAGWMCSGFQDSTSGFGMRMTALELAEFNVWRKARDPAAKDLKHSPGLRFLKYGKETTNKGTKSGKEGSWDYAKLRRQVVDVMDAFEFLPRYHGMQLVLQTDQSSGHGHASDDGLRVTGMNGTYGFHMKKDGSYGDKHVMRPSKLTAECIGPYPAVFKDAEGVLHDVKLKAGDTQHFQHGVQEAAGGPLPLPPFYDTRAPRQDVVNETGKVRKHLQR